MISREDVKNNTDLSGLELMGLDLRGMDLRNKIFRGSCLFKTDLTGCNCDYADFTNADMCKADLSNALIFSSKLDGANLANAIMFCTGLVSSSLRNAHMNYANLELANLSDADLNYAEMKNVNLRGAKLFRAKNIPRIVFAQTLITPEGELVVWKKLENEVIAKLRIPAHAQRHNATSRKCRASEAFVEGFYDKKGNVLHDVFSAKSYYDSKFLYSIGTTVKPDSFEQDRWIECGSGIHFFLTFEEAVEY